MDIVEHPFFDIKSIDAHLCFVRILTTGQLLIFLVLSDSINVSFYSSVCRFIAIDENEVMSVPMTINDYGR